jgi:hypothetical protein
MRSKQGLMFRMVPLIAVGSLVTLAACSDAPPPQDTVTKSSYTKTTTTNMAPGPVDITTGMPAAPIQSTTQTTTYSSNAQ